MGNVQRADIDNVGKDWLWDASSSTLVCERFFTVLCLVFCWAMLAYVVWRNDQSKNRKGEVKLNSKLWAVTVTTLVFFGLQQLSALFIVFPWLYDYAECMSFSYVNLALYYGSKFWLWTYNIIRVYDVFSSSGLCT